MGDSMVSLASLASPLASSLASSLASLASSLVSSLASPLMVRASLVGPPMAWARQSTEERWARSRARIVFFIPLEHQHGDKQGIYILG